MVILVYLSTALEGSSENNEAGLAENYRKIILRCLATSYKDGGRPRFGSA